ncbi:MAG TPA: dTMP kinase [Candidatus Bathyarchaeota archaeon]|nr:dTMP kinase [Candidatus Bathyarchaeota archaeon]
MGRGIFICIEGLDKCGKTTHSTLLVESLRKGGYDAVYTSEPSNGEIGRFIREYVLNRKRRIYAAVEALLFAADRAEHTETFIKPNLERGRIVVSDRYVFSSLAYQGAAGMDLDWIREINRASIDPDLAIYIDVPIDVIMRRFRGRRSVMERREIQEKVRRIYMHLVRRGELVMVNGNRPIVETAREIRRIVSERLNLKCP